jgi:hypothetical protein
MFQALDVTVLAQNKAQTTKSNKNHRTVSPQNITESSPGDVLSLFHSFLCVIVVMRCSRSLWRKYISPNI